jgi:hypothetical protein
LVNGSAEPAGGPGRGISPKFLLDLDAARALATRLGEAFEASRAALGLQAVR